MERSSNALTVQCGNSKIGTQPTGESLAEGDDQIRLNEDSAHESNPAQEEKYRVHSGSASGASEYNRQGFTPVATTLYANDLDTHDRELRFETLWKVHMGLLPTRWQSAYASGGNPLDEVARGHRIDPRWRDKQQLTECVLHELPAWVRQSAVSRVLDLDTSDIMGFNRHYRGLAGAAISAAIVVLYEREEVEDPDTETPWYDDVLCGVCDELGTSPEGHIRRAADVWGDWG